MESQRPISKFPIRREIPINIAYQKIHPAIVAEYEVREAAVFCNYNWSQFSLLTMEEQALCIAQFRLHNRIDMVVNQIAADHAKRSRPK